jgi:hypothetical protein
MPRALFGEESGARGEGDFGTRHFKIKKNQGIGTPNLESYQMYVDSALEGPLWGGMPYQEIFAWASHPSWVASASPAVFIVLNFVFISPVGSAPFPTMLT